jgi:hypothetical protein
MASGKASAAHQWLAELEKWARDSREALEAVLPELIQDVPAAEQAATEAGQVATAAGVPGGDVQRVEHVAEVVGKDALSAAEVAARIL